MDDQTKNPANSQIPGNSPTNDDPHQDVPPPSPQTLPDPTSVSTPVSDTFISSPESVSPPPSSSNSRTKLIGAIAAVILLAVAIPAGIFLTGQSQDIREKAEEPVAEAIAKVGKESIYQKDLDFEIANNLDKNNQDKKLFLEKLVTDSLILQAAQDEDLITLDASVFNSPSKDFTKRVKLIKDIQRKVEDKNIEGIHGSMVTVWFINNLTNTPGTLGLAKSKQTALEKITNLHERVVAKELTLIQAGEEIKKDSSQELLDVSYKLNAHLEFSLQTGDPQLAYNEEFTEKLLGLDIGEITDTYIGKTRDNQGKIIDAFYMFGSIDSKNTSTSIKDFADWVNQKRNTYEILYY